MHNKFFFGKFLCNLKDNLGTNSSEIGLALSLFSLVASTRAQTVIEIGRFKGLSTYALASALRFIDEEMNTSPDIHCYRPDINYQIEMNCKERKVISIDPHMQPEAEAIIKDNDLDKYVEFVHGKSETCSFMVQADIIFIDGNHTYNAVSADVAKYVSNYLKPGGYFILHDYYGWYKNGVNESPIKKVCDELLAQNKIEHLLIDTKFMSFMIFRKPL